MDGLGRRTASGYAGNRDDGPRNRTEAETHADRRVRPNAPPEEKDIGTAALRLIRDDCQAGSVRVPDCAGRPFMRSSSVVGTERQLLRRGDMSGVGCKREVTGLQPR